MAEPGTRAAEAAEDRSWRLRHLPVLLVATAVLGALAAVVGGVTGGADAALGAAVGVAVTAVSYTLTTVVLAWADARDPQLVLPFGVGLYVAKFSLLIALMIGVASTGWAGLIPLCLGIAVGVAVWTGVHVWWLTTVHARRVHN
ncbi:hypothetical protein DLE60_03660 [Micromonospora globispora]|uniref:ATP synthase subunit I n=1 Tax=Micromonospora globispora TaxID=1450148 RepID=A0A317JYZ7_9ACTN|nr:hypothetical protein [Micromonospora globispora]PWU45989.1 hypothetical protein DLJ46_19510 [Micromonospora globispora]PWU61833.1 hypothetical protein DLE60_03660 [Micromonospora globispora]RQW92627.1 hypothetical protein DKL51_18665 [Micromonospora globispora]